MKKKGKLIGLISTSILSCLLVAGTAVCGVFAQQITDVLCGTGDNIEGQEITEALQESDKLCQKIAEDSIVLLKNNDCLPLKADQTKLNVFGYGATEKGFLLKGIGSGSSTISNKKKVSLISALEQNGFTVNKDILAVYDSVQGRPANPSGGSQTYALAEPDLSKFDSLWDSAQDFSDIAMFVVSRDGGENIGEIPQSQGGNNADRTYLELSRQEEETLKALQERFSKVIVLLNTTNTMHAGFLEDDGISAALYVGITGQSGAMAIGKILKGEVNPSGKTTDIMAYSPDYDPTFKNSVVQETQVGDKTNKDITYLEDIYYGYKWYETADKEGYFDEVSNKYGDGYYGVVQYPFGYGLSYTNFKWEISEVNFPSGNNLTLSSQMSIKVAVTNTGNVPGKDVVELYCTPPYVKGEVEKAEVNLIDFVKTGEIPAGATQIVELKFSSYDLASYDCYDKNTNGSKTYEIDSGDYVIKLMNDSHNLDDCENNQMVLHAQKDLIFETDPVTEAEIKNRFTSSDAYASSPIDGSIYGIDNKYLSRADFKATFPQRAKVPSNYSSASNYLHDEPYKEITSMPSVGVDYGLRLAKLENGDNANLNQLKGIGGAKLVYNEELFEDLLDYESENWDKLIAQMTKNELRDLVSYGGFNTGPIESIGKPLFYDYDGPAGFNINSKTGSWNGESPDTESWTAYPSEALMGCSWNTNLMFQLGLSMGNEAFLTKINGWYAPGVNLHRSNYTARNYEYYSEDGRLSGDLAAQVIKGAKANGLYCYLKHFACSEPGPNPREVNTWLTEQNLRENYLKPFEICVKEGEANAMMTAFNRIGCIWSGANYALINDVLRGEWGFKGTVLTDWSTGGNLGEMNPRQGVRAGNDIWLNPMSYITGGLDLSNPIDVYCAQKAAKNIIFTYIDTWNFNKNFDDSELDGLTKVEMEIQFKDEVFAWWWIIVISLDVLSLGSLIAFITLMILEKNKKEEIAN